MGLPIEVSTRSRREGESGRRRRFGGQGYIPQVTRKIAELAALLQRRGLEPLIQVDGGINAETIGEAAAAGATVFVAGTAVFGEKDYAKAIATLKANGEAAVQNRARKPGFREAAPVR